MSETATSETTVMEKLKAEENVTDVDATGSFKLNVKDTELQSHNKGNEDNNGVENDTYAYVKRPGFTSEIFKIEIHHLPIHASYAQLKKLLDKKLKLKPHKIKVVDGSGHSCLIVFVTFKCEADRENALKCLENYEYRGQKLSVKKANPMEDPLVKRRREGTSEDTPPLKRMKENESEAAVPISIKIKNAVTPLWEMTYENQLKNKYLELKKFMIKWNQKIDQTSSVSKHSTPRKEKCILLDIKSSPVIDGYRNKCEFNIGLHPESGKKTVGFRISSYKEGSKSVAEADGCSNISQDMLTAAKEFEQYISDSSRPVFNPENHEGYWRQLTVRGSQNGDLMLIVVMHPQELTTEELKEEQSKISKFFIERESKITSLFFQAFAKKSQKDPPFEYVWGKKFIEETLLGMHFRISPEAFFQVNTLATEILYKTVEEMIEIKDDTVILDLCCGTGTIGLTLAKKAAKVIGVEICQEAVTDARHNAQLNDVKNAEFICAKVEDIIFDVLNRIKDQSVVAIVDPPRAGLNNRVIKAIRSAEKITKLVYLSCSPPSALNNFIDLGRPTSNNYKGKPFFAKKAIPVDLFPHTPHCELVVLFERELNAS